MNKLTEEEILNYIKPRNKNTSVDAITREFLEGIDLDTVQEVSIKDDVMLDDQGKRLFELDRFTPCAGTTYFKPSFAGRQLLLGKQGRKLWFSNGRWFV